MADMILFPSSYRSIAKVDEDLEKEYEAVLDSGLFETVFFGYDQWFGEGKLVLGDAPPRLRTAVYRGWMMKPEQYGAFYGLLLERNIKLVTDPEAYRLMHIFPNVYELLKEDTAKMKIYPLHTQIAVEELKADFKRFMVKDFVKSVKGTEFPRYFDQSVTQADFDRWMGVFYIDHEPVTVSRNSGQGSFTPEPPRGLLDKYRNLSSPFYTIDYAELEDGSWKILEAGDGGVSGLSENQDYGQFFRALYHCL